MKNSKFSADVCAPAVVVSGDLVSSSGYGKRAEDRCGECDQGGERAWHVDFGMLPTARRRGSAVHRLRKWVERTRGRAGSVGLFGVGRDGDLVASAAFLMALFVTAVVTVMSVVRAAGWWSWLVDALLAFGVTATGGFVFGVMALKGLALMGVSLVERETE